MSASGQEIEAKFYVHDLDKIRARLQPPPPFGHLPQIRDKALRNFVSFYSRIWGRLGEGLIQSRVLETNIRFDLPDAQFSSQGRLLRLRRDSEARLTYKSASKNEEGVLSRTEIEFTVEDYDKAKQFIEALGYQSIFHYEKYRTTYEFKDCHIMLDELPFGKFIEIEGESLESIRVVADVLDLKWNTAIAAGYHALFQRLCLSRPDLDPTQLTFPVLSRLEISAEDLSVRAADE